MKKILPFILVLIGVLILAGCDSSPLTSATPTDTSTNQTVTPNQTTPQETPQIILNSNELSLSVGTNSKLIPSLAETNTNGSAPFRFESLSPNVAYVDQNGNVTAVEEGSAVIKVSDSANNTVECKVTVTKRSDKFDKQVLKYADELTWMSFYGEGVEKTESGHIVFKPDIWELRSDQSNIYQVYLRFTHLPSQKINCRFTFPSVLLDPIHNVDGSVDLVLQPSENGGFCPVAGESYEVEIIIIHKYRKIPVYFGKYENVKAADSIKASPNYKPTPMPEFMPKEEGQQYITYYATEGGVITGGALQAHKVGDTGFEVTATPSEGYKFVMWDDGSTNPKRSDRTAKYDTEYTAYFVKASGSDMPIANMYIFTSTGGMVNTKQYMDAKMLIVGSADGKFDITADLQIKGRGNSSWNGYVSPDKYDSKNSYRIKFEEQQHLLGIGDSKNKDWILNSNKFDLSGLRNYLIWDLADRMATLPYVTDCQWVQLYINAEYRGMYMVTERVEVAKDRVNVDDTVDSSDKGYLIEIDFRGTDEGQPYFYIDGYGCSSNDNPREFVIKSECTEEDKQFIKQYIQQCHNAIVKGDRAEIEKLMDLASLVDMYIIEELTKDVDVGAASFFMQKDPGGKIYFTAPWDFDFGFGTYGKAISYEEMVSIGDEGCTWFSALLEQEWFRQEVLKRMAELDGSFKDTLDHVKEKADELESSADKNAIFWDMYGNRFHGYVSSQVSAQLNSYDEHIDFLINWSENRWAYMKNFISSYKGYDDYINQEEELPLLPEIPDKI